MNLFPFFIMKAARKILREQNKSVRDCEFLIIGDYGGIVECVIDNLYPHARFLTVFSAQSPDFDLKAEDVFFDCGLKISIMPPGKDMTGMADIIINCDNKTKFRYDSYFKENAVYFDCTGQKDKNEVLRRRRPDMTVIGGFCIYAFRRRMSLPEFELAFEPYCKEYGRMTETGYDTGMFEVIKERIERVGTYVIPSAGAGGNV